MWIGQVGGLVGWQIDSVIYSFGRVDQWSEGGGRGEQYSGGGRRGEQWSGGDGRQELLCGGGQVQTSYQVALILGSGLIS